MLCSSNESKNLKQLHVGRNITCNIEEGWPPFVSKELPCCPNRQLPVNGQALATSSPKGSIYFPLTREIATPQVTCSAGWKTATSHIHRDRPRSINSSRPIELRATKQTQVPRCFPSTCLEEAVQCVSPPKLRPRYAVARCQNHLIHSLCQRP